MRSTNRPVVPGALVWCALAMAGCGGSGSEGATTGSYTSVGDEGLVFDFKSGGTVTMSAKD
jgi:hypothetical protein